MATRSSDIVRGMGLGMRFLEMLIERIVASGGYPEMIHMMTLDNEMAKTALENAVQAIVKSPWRVPRTLMERISAEDSIRSNGSDHYVEEDMRFSWWHALDLLGIPYVRFGKTIGQNDYEVAGPLPKEIADQLIGKPLRYPMIVTYEGEEYILAENQGSTRKIGEQFDSEFEWLGFANTKYFDLNR